jgi:hypothetical protein
VDLALFKLRYFRDKQREINPSNIESYESFNQEMKGAVEAYAR